MLHEPYRFCGTAAFKLSSTHGWIIRADHSRSIHRRYLHRQDLKSSVPHSSRERIPCSVLYFVRRSNPLAQGSCRWQTCRTGRPSKRHATRRCALHCDRRRINCYEQFLAFGGKSQRRAVGAGEEMWATHSHTEE